MSTLARPEKLDGYDGYDFSVVVRLAVDRRRYFLFRQTHKAVVEFVQKWCYLYSPGFEGFSQKCQTIPDCCDDV